MSPPLHTPTPYKWHSFLCRSCSWVVWWYWGGSACGAHRFSLSRSAHTSNYYVIYKLYCNHLPSLSILSQLNLSIRPEPYDAYFIIGTLNKLVALLSHYAFSLPIIIYFIIILKTISSIKFMPIKIRKRYQAASLVRIPHCI